MFRGKLEYLVHWKGYGIKEEKWRPAEDVQGLRWLMSEFHCRDLEVPQHISALDFTNLPFCLITNLTDTADMVPSDWAKGYCMLGHHTFEGGVNVRFSSFNAHIFWGHISRGCISQGPLFHLSLHHLPKPTVLISSI